MCGRFVRKRDASSYAKAFRVARVSEDLQPGFNIAPTHNVAVIVNSGARELVAMRWGLVPARSADLTVGSRLINARAETLTSRSAFRDAFKKRRCLVVADGFYEWRKQGGHKTPLYFHLKSDRPFGFAGLYEVWNSPAGEPISTCTIITTEPNELVQPIHNRMPVILAEAAEDFWLDAAVEDHRRLLDLLEPYPADEMDAYVVSSLVNSVKNDSPECIEACPENEPLLLF